MTGDPSLLPVIASERSERGNLPLYSLRPYTIVIAGLDPAIQRHPDYSGFRLKGRNDTSPPDASARLSRASIMDTLSHKKHCIDT